jgi:hypothetical protein
VNCLVRRDASYSQEQFALWRETSDTPRSSIGVSGWYTKLVLHSCETPFMNIRHLVLFFTAMVTGTVAAANSTLDAAIGGAAGGAVGAAIGNEVGGAKARLQEAP